MRTPGRSSRDAQVHRAPRDRPPAVSVGLPVYNGERYVGEAIESVLSQTLENLELIVCDNASTDATEAICREFAARDRRLRYDRSDTNLGAAPNFNRAFRRAAAPYFKWIAADDALEETFLERTLERLEADRGLVAAGTGYLVVNELDGTTVEPAYDHEFTSPRPAERLRKLFDQADGGEHLVWAVARSVVLERIGLFQAFVRADFYLAVCLLLQGPVEFVSEPLNRLRVHDETYSWKLRRENEGRDNMQGPAEAAWWDTRGIQRGARLPQWALLTRLTRLAATAPLPLRERLEIMALLGTPYARRQAVILTKELAFAMRLGPAYLRVRDARDRVRGMRPAQANGAPLAKIDSSVERGSEIRERSPVRSPRPR